METFNVAIQVGDLQRSRFEDLEALADTGATTTVIPASVLDRLGVRPTSRQTFEYASGEQIEWDAEIATSLRSETPLVASPSSPAARSRK